MRTAHWREWERELLARGHQAQVEAWDREHEESMRRVQAKGLELKRAWKDAGQRPISFWSYAFAIMWAAGTVGFCLWMLFGR